MPNTFLLHQQDSEMLLNRYVALETDAGWLSIPQQTLRWALRDEILRRMLSGDAILGTAEPKSRECHT